MAHGDERARCQRLPQGAWLEALLDPGVTLHFESYGYMPLPSDWGFVDRSVPEHLVYAVIENELSAQVAGRSRRLRSGGFCLLPPGTHHTFIHAERHRPVTLHYFRLELRRHGAALHLARTPVILEAAPILRQHLERLHDDRQSGDPDGSVRVKASLALLFSNAFRLAEASSGIGGVLSVTQRSQLYDLVREPGGSRLQPADLAHHMELSLDYFTRLFRRTFGVPPRRWLVEQRINDAATLLADSRLHVSQIAHELGYRDVYQFSRQFKVVAGVSPRNYRRRAQAISS